MSRFFGLALSLFALLLATSCASSRSGTQPPATTSHSFATYRAAARVSKSDTDVGLAIFRRLMHDARSDENPVVSPWGLGRAMDILYNGAAGKTKADMTRALHLDALDVEAVDGANEWLARNFTSAAGGVSIQSADTLWYETGLQLDPNFADRIATAFGVRLQSIDFANRNAAAQIDDWVRANSRGGNPAFTAPVDEFTRALLVDVLNMDGLWNKHFDPALTRPHEFTTASGRPVTVAMMKMTDSFAHAQGAGYQVVSIPYHGWQLSMDIILPEASSKGMRSVESVLRSTSLDNLLGRAPHARGTVEIPRFDVRFSANLNGPISQLGLGRIFDPTGADFSGMWVHANYPVNRVLQQCYVSVNEWGTRAGSTTTVTMQALVKPSAPFTLLADHPFVFLIRDSEIGTVLFAGLVNNPS